MKWKRIEQKRQLNKEAFQRELAFIAEEEETFISLKKGNRKSVTEKSNLVNKGCQINIKVNDAPDIRKIRNTTYEINDAISTVSSEAGVSVNKARIATKIVCERLYGHKYKLEAPVPEPSQSNKRGSPVTDSDSEPFHKKKSQ